ncbi:MAG: helix-turn-helix domain protein [Segetibacter sp.]|jgi:transcriptional regulator with XRE-family HTH domain|nr:helix-turn-helix domain protein [Segetibacter sp.]
MTKELRKVHEGRNLKRIRDILGIKQSTLASELGDEWNQKKISQLEDKEIIEPNLLDQIAEALKVPAQAIKDFSEESAYNIFGNTVTNNDNVAFIQNNPTFNPIDKLIEIYDENKNLYERLLQAEKDKVELLQKLLNEKK